MFLAIAAFIVGQMGAATVAAGAFWFRWHGLHLGNKKPPQGLLPLEAFRSILASIAYQKQPTDIKCTANDF